MYSRPVLDPISHRMKSNPEFFIIITAEVHDSTVSGSHSPDRDSEDGDREIMEEEEHAGDGGERGGERGCSIRGTREKDLSEDRIIHSETRLFGGNTRPLDGEDDGFKTPVPADQREIDLTRECPPAPKKPTPVARRKRKELPGDGGDGNGISLVIHLSDEEVVAMFPEILPVCKKIKKARRDDSHD